MTARREHGCIHLHVLFDARSNALWVVAERLVTGKVVVVCDTANVQVYRKVPTTTDYHIAQQAEYPADVS